MNGHSSCRTWLVPAMVVLLLPAWGCVGAGDPDLTGVYQTWDSVIERWIAKSKPDLILELGPPQFHKEAGDGAEELVWDMTVPSMSGLAETYNTLPLYGGVDCRLLFLADVDGIIQSGKREGCN